MSLLTTTSPVVTVAKGRRARIYEIDLLRAIAAFSVVFYHWSYRGHVAGFTAMQVPEIDPVTRYGYLGVELFFMISGFVIMMSARAGTVRDFLVSRIVRLYPAFWCCCTLTFVVAIWLSAGNPRFQFTVPQLGANLTMFGNYLGVASIDNVYWSLFVEMRFYLMCIVVLWLGWMSRIESLLWVWLVISTTQRVVRTGPLWHVFNAEYAPLFIAGAVLFLVHESGWSRSRLGMLLSSYLLSVWQAFAHIESSKTHGEDEMVVATVMAVFFVAMALVASDRLIWARRSWWLPLGALTYPLYLLHQNIGYMAFNSLSDTFDRNMLFVAGLCVAVAGSYLVHYLVEKPLARVMKQLLSRSLRLKAEQN
jgi:peptidoglycan/LPS O-acetylase OafA/YrhL